MAHLPADIVADILSRLPVEPILRFRCVSKPWCDLIDSPDFTKLHLKRSLDNHNNRNLVLEVEDIRASSENTSLYLVNMTTMIDSSSSRLYAAVRVDDHPCSSSPEVCGSCDGLVLLCDGENHDFSIWNPSTKKHRKLPPPISTSDDDFQPLPDYYTASFYGFGYDSVNDDYKVVKITQFHGGKSIVPTTFHSQVQVYSLKTNSWTKIVTDLPHCLSLDKSRGTLINGVLHWAMSELDGSECRFIVAFDITTMEHSLVPMPANYFSDFSIEVLSLEGRLCLSCNSEDARCDAWVMKDYGVEESWTKLFSVDLPGDIDSFNYATPVALSKDGTMVLLLQDWRRFIWYDTKHKVFQKVPIRDLQDISHAELCVKSLVPLTPNMVVKSSSNVKKRRIEENNDKNADKTGRKR